MKSKTAKPAKTARTVKPAEPAKKTAARAAAPAPAPAAKPLPDLLRLVYKALDEKKAGGVRVLCVAEQSSITDFLVVATGTSEPHLRALRVELEKVIDATGTRIIGMDTGETGSGWLVIDAFDVMIHVLTQENRERYSLENLWKDAIEIPPAELNDKPARKKAAPKKASAPKKAPSKKTAPKKTGAAAKRKKTA